MDLISNLPPEVARIIFSYLDLNDIRNALKVSDQWAEIMADNNFCSKMCKQNNILQMEEDKRSIRCTEIIKNSEAPVYQSLWEYYLKLNENWLERSLEAAKKYCFSRLYSYMGILYVDEKVTVFLTKNSPKRNYYYNIEVRNNFDMKIVDKFRVPDKLNKCTNVARKCDLLVVGITFEKHCNYSIFVRNIENKTFCWKLFFDSTVQWERYLFGARYFEMAVNKELVAAEIRYDSEIRLINLNDGNTKFNIPCVEVVLYMKFYKQKLCIIKSLVHRIVQIWDTERETEELSFALNIPLNVSWCLGKLKEYLVFSSESPMDLNVKTISTFTLKENRFLYTTQWRSLVPLMLQNYRVICVEAHNCVKMIDCYTGNVVTTIIDNENKFYEVDANSRFLISATKNDDFSPISKFKIFDFYTGHFLRSLDFTNDVATLNFRKNIKTLQVKEGIVIMHYHKSLEHKNEIFYLNFDV